MKKKIKKPTWVIHHVFDEYETNYHTHGLNKYGSLELEINFPIQQNLAGHILNEIGLKIANGKKYKSNDTIEDIVNVKLKVIETKGVHSDAHGDEKVLRIILPDENHKFPWDEGCNPIYQKQIWFAKNN